jgi:hypothetical protein
LPIIAPPLTSFLSAAAAVVALGLMVATPLLSIVVAAAAAAAVAMIAPLFSAAVAVAAGSSPIQAYKEHLGQKKAISLHALIQFRYEEIESWSIREIHSPVTDIYSMLPQ